MDLRHEFKTKIRYKIADLLKVNYLAVPTLEKVVVSMGLGEALTNKGLLDLMSQDLALICGQKPAYAKARKDISNFNRLKKGDIIGLYATIRGARMWDFVEKLIYVVLPGVKDFKGLSKKSFDGKGNYNIGIKNHLVFPEVDQNRIDKPRGLQITIVTTANNDENGYLLLKEFGLPFRD